MNKYIEEYDIPPYLFQFLNVVFGLLFIYILYKVYQHFMKRNK